MQFTSVSIWTSLKFCCLVMVNILPNDCSKLKALANDKIDVTAKLKLVLGRVENIMGKGENAGYHHFLLFP